MLFRSQVEVEIQKVDALRHQIDLAVVLPEGADTAMAGQDAQDANASVDAHADPFAPIPVLSEG